MFISGKRLKALEDRLRALEFSSDFFVAGMHEPISVRTAVRMLLESLNLKIVHEPGRTAIAPVRKP